jgi:hypothetical protein
MPARTARHIPNWLCLTALIAGLPLIIPAVIAWQALERRRRQREVQRCACETCGRILGSAALRLGDAAWDAEHRKILDRLPPGARVRIMRTVDAICASCGTWYRWVEGLRTFRATRHDEAEDAAAAAEGARRKERG